MDEEAYLVNKTMWEEDILRNGIRFLPSGKTQFTELKRRNLMTDTFTPRTIKDSPAMKTVHCMVPPPKAGTDLRNLKIYFWLERIKAMWELLGRC